MKWWMVLSNSWSLFALAAAEPQFPQMGAYVDISSSNYPLVFVYDAKADEIKTFAFARKESGPRCFAELNRFGVQDDFYAHRSGNELNGLKSTNGISFRFLRNLPKENASAEIQAKGKKFVRVADEGTALRLLLDHPSCESSITATGSITSGRKSPTPQNNPLILDLAGSGIKLGATTNFVDFDMNVDGFKERITWPDDAGAHFLALDRNGNGSIDDGSELFAAKARDAWEVTHPHGFLALRTFDSNQNGLIEAKDGIYDHLQLWNDANRNGISEPEELKGLCDLGVEGISTSFQDNFVRDEFGNGKIQDAILRLKGGETKKIYELNFINPT